MTHKRRGKALQIDVYDGYGNTKELMVTGRLFADRHLDQVEAKDGHIKNLVKTSRRFVLREIEQVWVRMTCQEQIIETQTNDEGIFRATFHPQNLLPGLHTVQVSLSLKNGGKYHAAPGEGKFIIHTPDSDKVGIISDIDDTILQTHTTRKIRMLRTVLFSNYKTQLPVAGMNEIFHAIHYGPQGDGYDATHYVSSSPDNLYSRINLFLDYRNFPEGSIDLKNIGLGKENDSIFDHAHYKFKKIRRILESYPQRKFILFGDSGERDPEIYRQIMQTYQERILGVYIHNVNASDPFDPRFQGELLFSEPEKVKKDLLSKGLIYPC